MASGSEWNLWVWLLGVVVRRYIDFLILLIPTPLVSVLFYSIPTFCSNFFNVFRSCIYYNKKNIFGKMKCDVMLMIDRDVAEKRYENKVGMSSYY